jgi:hypothetical protein
MLRAGVISSFLGCAVEFTEAGAFVTFAQKLLKPPTLLRNVWLSVVSL